MLKLHKGKVSVCPLSYPAWFIPGTRDCWEYRIHAEPHSEPPNKTIRRLVVTEQLLSEDREINDLTTIRTIFILTVLQELH